MKCKLLMWCLAPLALGAQKVTVTPGAVVTIKTTQVLPNLKNEGHVVLVDSSTLTLLGIFDGSGRVSVDTSSAMTAGIGSIGTLYFSPTKNTLSALYVSGALTLGNDLIIAPYSGRVKIQGGTLVSDSFLTLRSAQWGTARIDSSFGVISGPVTVERYIPANRAWRFLTVPFATSQQSINAAWQGGYTSTELRCPSQYSGTPGFDTHITYNGSNGYDLNTTKNPSLYILQANAWTALPSTRIPKITRYAGYAIFVRGDRTICLTQAVDAPPVPTVLRASGTIHLGSIVRNTTIAIGEYFLEGNPYASSIDVLLSTNRSSGIVPEVFWIFDPGYGTNGGYVAYNHGAITPTTSNYQDAASVRIIQSGQAYLLQTASATQTLQYEETDKISVNRSLVFGRPITESSTRIQLLSPNALILDGVLVRHSRVVEHKSSAKMWNFAGPGIALSRSETLFSIETRALEERDTSFLFFRRLQQTKYVLELSYTGNDTARLIDRFLDQEVEIHDTVRYTFSVSDSASFVKRFMIVYTHHKEESAPIVHRGIYPNPVTDWLYFGNDIVGTKKIVDVLGKIYLTTTTQNVNCARLASGTYYVLVQERAIPFQKK